MTALNYYYSWSLCQPVKKSAWLLHLVDDEASPTTRDEAARALSQLSIILTPESGVFASVWASVVVRFARLLLLLLRHSAKSLNAQEERLATSP